MNCVDYQPTGVYPQFVSDPMLLNNSGSKNDVKKHKKSAKTFGLCAGAAMAALLIAGYKKNVNAIKLKETTFKNADSFETFIKNGVYSADKKNELKQIWERGSKFQEGITGKIHNAGCKFCDFIKRNFYNYQ